MTSISSALRARWLSQAAQQAQGFVHLNDVHANLSIWLDQQLRRITDPDFANRFALACPIPGARPTDYAQRIRTLPEAGQCLLGIRFFGGDHSKPFVDLLAWETLPGPNAWPTLCDAIAADFAVFQPRSVRVLLDTGVAIANARPDQVWVAGALKNINDIPVPSFVTTMRSDASEAESVARAYTGEEVTGLSPADEDDLRDCEIIVRLEIDGAWGGVAAAQRARQWAVDGYLIVEEVLAPSFRGKGLGPVLQQALLIEIRAEASQEAVVFGTIDAKNLPSRHTARRCGRQERAQWWFIPTV
ncbi:MAG: GNAT family N-acetyltransferase [Myxococcota bacterium]